MKKVIALFLAALFVSPASAESWRVVSKTGKTVSFVDTDSLTRRGENIRYWRDLRYKPEAKRRFNRSVTLVAANCSDKSYTALITNLYNGRALVERSPARAMAVARRNTAEWREIDFVCSNRFFETEAVDPDEIFPRVSKSSRSRG